MMASEGGNCRAYVFAVTRDDFDRQQQESGDIMLDVMLGHATAGSSVGLEHLVPNAEQRERIANAGAVANRQVEAATAAAAAEAEALRLRLEHEAAVQEAANEAEWAERERARVVEA